MVWVQIVIAIVMMIVGELLRPKPRLNNPQPSAVGDFSFPTADASRVIPVFWGTCKLAGPNTTWFGNLQVIAIKKKVKSGWFSSQTIIMGYKYYLGVQLVYAYGEIDEFINLLADDKPLTVSTKAFTGDVCAFNIDSPTILSTDDPPAGVIGPARLYKGTFTQPVNAYLSTQWSEPDMSAFRPLCHLVLEDVYLGNSDTPPPITLIARRTPNPLGLTAGKHNINGDANIANCVYEVMTNRLWGMKIPVDKIDMASFIDCGNTLADEGLGISMLVQTKMLGKDLMAEMLRHADGIVYADPLTGLYTMVLARDDYDIEDLIVLDNSNIKEGTFEFSRTSWEMTKNTIIVNYTDRESFDVKPVQYQDLANIDVRGGMIDAEEINFLGYSNASAALYAAARASKVRSSPLVRAQFTVNRVGYRLRPGSVTKVRKPDRGLAEIIVRVIDIDYGNIDEPDIKLVVMEDIFAVNGIAYTEPTPSEWVNPLAPPVPLLAQRLVEAPAFNQGDFSLRYVITLAVQNGAHMMGYDVWSDPLGGTAFVQTNSVIGSTPSGLLVNAYNANGDEEDAVGFIINSTANMQNVDDGDANSRAAGENLVLIDNEIIAFNEIVNNGDGTYTIRGNWRGVLDTVAANHTAGTRVYFMSEGSGVTDEEGYSSNVTVNAKLLPKNLSAILPIASASAVSVTTNNRALRPLPPGKVRINAARVGTGTVTGAFVITWAHRNRLDGTVASQAEASRTPEEGTLYNLRFYNNTTNALLVGVSGVNATTANVALNHNGTVRVELESVRDGLVSLQKHALTFTHDPAGGVVNTIVADEPEYVLDGGGA